MFEKASSTSGKDFAVSSTNLATLFDSSKDTFGFKKLFTKTAPSSRAGANSVPILESKNKEKINAVKTIEITAFGNLNSLYKIL